MRINIFNHLQTRGVDMKSNPLLLGNRKLHAATNMVFEEGVFRTRPEFEYIPLGSTGTFQGASAYKPSKGLSYAPLSDTPDGLLTVVSGAVFFNKVGDCEGERISRAVFCDKGDVNIFQAEDYAIFHNKQTSTYWWRGEDDIVESPGDLGERWDDREMPETVIRPLAPVPSIENCENFDYSKIVLNFLVIDNDTEEFIPGASFVLIKNASAVKRRTSDMGGRFTMNVSKGNYTYNVSKLGYQVITGVKLNITESGSYTIRMKPDTCGFQISNIQLNPLDETEGSFTLTNTGSITSNVTSITSTVATVINPTIPRAVNAGTSQVFTISSDASLALKPFSVTTDCTSYAGQFPDVTGGGGGGGGTCGYSITGGNSNLSGANFTINNTGTSVMTLSSIVVSGGAFGNPADVIYGIYVVSLPFDIPAGESVVVYVSDNFESSAAYVITMSCNSIPFDTSGNLPYIEI